MKPKEYITARLFEVDFEDLSGAFRARGKRHFVAVPRKGDFLSLEDEHDHPGMETGLYIVVSVAWTQGVFHGARISVPNVFVRRQGEPLGIG